MMDPIGDGIAFSQVLRHEPDPMVFGGSMYGAPEVPMIPLSHANRGEWHYSEPVPPPPTPKKPATAFLLPCGIIAQLLFVATFGAAEDRVIEANCGCNLDGHPSGGIFWRPCAQHALECYEVEAQ